jgi:hypothetical protein
MTARFTTRLKSTIARWFETVVAEFAWQKVVNA